MIRLKFAIAGILLVVLSSCNDFLSVQPETSVTSESFLQSQEDFEQAIIGAYAPLQEIYEVDWMMAEMRSDNTHFMYDVANRGSKQDEDLATFLVETNNDNVLSKWENNYLIISRANDVLSKIDQLDFDQSVKDDLKGEAFFLRGLAYFDLVRNFGGVPLFIGPPSTYEETFQSRAPVDEVYDQVISDVSSAADLLTGLSSERATSGAAYTLLADVYLTLEQWENAEEALTLVENMNYDLLDDYSEVFRPSNEGNQEMIFEVQYLGGTAQNIGSNFPYSFLPVLSDPSVITGVSPANQNDNGSFNTPSPDLIEAYEDTVNDDRYRASIAYHTGPSPLVGITYDHTPYINKFQHPHSQCCETDQNWPVYRYAEVLLMLAEAINEQGGRQSEAEGYLNQVRNRAGLSETTASSEAELRDIILEERRIELAFENKRWHDLVRTDRAVAVMSDYGTKVKNNPQEYYYPEGSFPFEGSYNISENDHLYPIPVAEININPDLEQNPGY